MAKYTEADRALAEKLLKVYRKSEALSAYDSAIAHPRAALNSQIVALNGSRFAHDSAPPAKSAKWLEDKKARDSKRAADKAARDAEREAEDKARDAKWKAEDENEDPDGVDSPESEVLNASRGSTVKRNEDCNATDSALAFDYDAHANKLAVTLAKIRRESAWNMPSLLWQAQVASDAQLPKQSGVSMDEAIPGYSRIGRQNGGRDCIKTRMG